MDATASATTSSASATGTDVASTETHLPTGPFTPVNDQYITIYILIVFFVMMFGIWFLPGARTIVAPLKLLTIGFHEFFHIVAAILTGGKVHSICIDPAMGGCTRVDGGKPRIILAAGYIGSTIIGGLYVFCAWHTLASKVISFVTAIGLIVPLVLIRDKLTIFLTVLWLGLLVGLWFVDHGSALRWYSLFLGVMNSLFAIWDFTDDRLFKKINDSDCTQFALLFPRTRPYQWALIWILVQLGAFATFILLGLLTWGKTSVDQMNQQAAKFLPT